MPRKPYYNRRYNSRYIRDNHQQWQDTNNCANCKGELINGVCYNCVIVNCPNDCSIAPNTRKFIDQHKNTDCSKRKIVCVLGTCSVLINYDLEQHATVCLGREISCDVCNEMVRRIDMSDHKTTECPLANIECSYCERVFLKKHSDIHIEMCTLKNTVRNLKYDNNKLKKNMKKLLKYLARNIDLDNMTSPETSDVE